VLFVGEHTRRATSNGFLHEDVATVDAVAGCEEACIWATAFDSFKLLSATRTRLATKLYSCIVRSSNTHARVKFREKQRQDSAHKRVAHDVFMKPGVFATDALVSVTQSVCLFSSPSERSRCRWWSLPRFCNRGRFQGQRSSWTWMCACESADYCLCK
jgi:hypothetical protein